jgi:twitching motility two-component system response regulator PilG
MLSSKDTMFDRARGRLAGSSEHLPKPFTKEDLLKMVNSQTAFRPRRQPMPKTLGVI